MFFLDWAIFLGVWAGVSAALLVALRQGERAYPVLGHQVLTGAAVAIGMMLALLAVLGTHRALGTIGL